MKLVDLTSKQDRRNIYMILAAISVLGSVLLVSGVSNAQILGTSTSTVSTTIHTVVVNGTTLVNYQYVQPAVVYNTTVTTVNVTIVSTIVNSTTCTIYLNNGTNNC